MAGRSRPSRKSQSRNARRRRKEAELETQGVPLEDRLNSKGRWRLEHEQGFGTPGHPGGGEELQALMAAGATGACTGDGDSWANGPCSKQPPGAQESPVNLDVDLDVDLADRDQLAEPEAKLRAKQLELDARERALGRREKGLNKVKGMLRRQSDGLGAQRAEFDRAKAQVPPTHASHTCCHLHSPHSTSTQVPTEIQHASYLTGQVALDLTKLSKQMQHSESAGKLLLKEMPEISKLAGKLKEAKPGSLKATKIHNKLVGTVEATGSLLFRGKLEHAKLAHAVKRNAQVAYDRCIEIGKL